MTQTFPTVEFDPGLAPLARMKMPDGRVGYVHYATLQKKLEMSWNPSAEAQAVLKLGLSVDLGGTWIWPENFVVVRQYPIRSLKVMLGTNTLSDPITLPHLVWFLGFNRKAPHGLAKSALYVVAGPIPDLLAVTSMVPWPFGNVQHHGEVCWGGVKIDRLTIEHPDDVDRMFWASKPNNDLLASLVYPKRLVEDLEPDPDDVEEDDSTITGSLSLTQWVKLMHDRRQPAIISWDLVKTGSYRVSSTVLMRAEKMRGV